MSAGNRSGRESTQPGMHAVLPEGHYQPPPAVVRSEAGAHRVEFHGEDGRHRTLDFSECEMPGWHADLAAVLSQRIGPAGGLRTSASALAAWIPLKMFLRSLSLSAQPPAIPEHLSIAHVDRFIDERRRQTEPIYGLRQVTQVAQMLRMEPVASRIDDAVHERMTFRVPGVPSRRQQGYSDGELHRLIGTARADVARLRERLRAGEAALAEVDRKDGQDDRLSAVAAGHSLRYERDTKYAAAQVFPLRGDMPAMMVLLVALTGRNVETIKELPAEHRILEDRAVEVRLTKRRTGSGQWAETVAWEIGRPGQELRTPGGLYLLLHELMSRSRSLAADPRWFWSYWRASHRERHGSPFRASLTAGVDIKAWGLESNLAGDDGSPLKVDFRRLRISTEVRRVKQMGGHLPSAARSNTVPVLFRNYVRGDPTAIDWAQGIAHEAIADAEAAAIQAHHRRLEDHRGELTIAHADVDPPSADEGVWSNCRDSTHNPNTGNSCRATFLDCFHCGNAIITTSHLPRLLSLLEALDSRRASMTDPDWWRRYGPAWAAIRHDILGKFTASEIDDARRQSAPDALLDLVEAPWEHP